MTENMNLQHALLKRIEEVGAGIVDVREGGRVSEMMYGEGDSWVGLKVGEKWVRGSLVVSATEYDLSPTAMFLIVFAVPSRV